MQLNRVVTARKDLNWIFRRRWKLIVLMAVFFILFEVIEHLIKQELFVDPWIWAEISILILLLLSIGVLIESLRKSTRMQQHTMEILTYRHNLLMELAKFEDWNALVSVAVMIPGRIAQVSASGIYVRSPISNRFELVHHWTDEVEGFDLAVDCHIDLERTFGRDYSFTLHQSRLVEGNLDNEQLEYYFLLNSSHRLIGVIWFRLMPGIRLTPNQMDIFENIGDELSLALRAGQDHKKFSDLQGAEMAMAERRSISHYLHDNLSQNLVYLQIKLDQLLANLSATTAENLNADLLHMREAVKQSYDIVRGKIESNYPETTPVLSNLLRQHAKKVSERTNLEITIHRNGAPYPISREIQQAVFYFFQEALSNVEKHAKAGHVEVLVDWQEDLKVTIADDGSGFNPRNVDNQHHFGLMIMEERIQRVNGRITVESHENVGTTITVCIPISTKQTPGISNGTQRQFSQNREKDINY